MRKLYTASSNILRQCEGNLPSATASPFASASAVLLRQAITFKLEPMEMESNPTTIYESTTSPWKRQCAHMNHKGH